MSNESTSNPEAVVDLETMRVTRTITIRAPRGIVWETLTDPTWIAQWFGDTAEFPDGMHEGATGVFGWHDHGDFPVRVERFQPESSFSFTWGTPGQPIRDDNATTAVFTLDEVGDETRLTVAEDGFDRLGDAETARRAALDNREGWTSELDELSTLVERRLATDQPEPSTDGARS